MAFAPVHPPDPPTPGGLPAADASAVVRGLRAALGLGGEPVVLIETHISWVLLAGDFAWKIKKPVRLGFLDFSTLEARRRCCEEELRLNRRLAPSLYLAVVPVHATPEGPRLEGAVGAAAEAQWAPSTPAAEPPSAGPPSAEPVSAEPLSAKPPTAEPPGRGPPAPGPVVEVALQMRRLPAGSLASERLAAGTLEARDLARFAERLAAFHRGAPQARPDAGFGTPACVAAQALAVLEALQALQPPGPPWPLSELRFWLDAQALRLGPRWQERLMQGRVREVHGDLHLDNVLVLDEDVTAFDCIEFDPALRWIDVISDLAFPVMDLMARGRTDLAFGLLDDWLERSGDHAGLPILRHSLVQRALVRALVACLRERDGLAAAGPGAAAYLRLAQSLTEPAALRPRLLITHGLPGSGKSLISRRLLGAVGGVRVRSDVERKRLAGLGALERAGPAARGPLYGPAATESTYQRLARAAGDALEGGFPTLVDAAFLRLAERERFRTLAEERGVPFHILDCQAPLHLLRERVRLRSATATDPSDADESVLEHLARVQEPLDAAEAAWTLTVHTAQNPDLDALGQRWMAAEGGSAQRR